MILFPFPWCSPGIPSDDSRLTNTPLYRFPVDQLTEHLAPADRDRKLPPLSTLTKLFPKRSQDRYEGIRMVLGIIRNPTTPIPFFISFKGLISPRRAGSGRDIKQRLRPGSNSISGFDSINRKSHIRVMLIEPVSRNLGSSVRFHAFRPDRIDA